MREKQINIPESLWWMLATYVLEPDLRTPENEQALKKGIYSKLDRQIEHDLYTKYKSAPSEELKEAARQEYLARKGIPSNVRW